MLTLVSTVIVACGLLSSNVVARDDATDTKLQIQARALDSQPQSRIEADQAMDGAVAAAVIGAISTQFGEREVAVRLDEVAVQPASVRDRSVNGAGRLRIGDDDSWIPFRFDVLYDTRTASVSYPAITLGDGAAAREIALDSSLARALGRRVDAALHSEFAQQPVQLVVGRATTAEAGTRYLLVEALGTADFADEGVVPAQVQALYDRKTGEWLRVDYELGTTSNWSDRGVAVATR
ncbi:hypothetical protein [Novilysobacter erysipheiresistens]|uniref:Uncharacterized protein n=1 Tax=Novilysobacter erysipheiresistens TaxID=1749332 RepID=A0ABU7Z0E7_9GAMM